MSTILSPEAPSSPAPEEILSDSLPVPVVNRVVTNRRRRYISTMYHAMLRHGLLALLLPLGLLFLAFLTHG